MSIPFESFGRRLAFTDGLLPTDGTKWDFFDRDDDTCVIRLHQTNDNSTIKIVYEESD
jgi:hypothetical protein